MKDRTKRWAWGAGLFLFLAALSAATYWNVLSDSDQVLAFNDGNIEFALSPAYRYPASLLRCWDNQIFLGIGNGAAGLTVTSVNETIGAVFARRGGPALILALCGLAVYWTLRQYGFRRPAAALTAAIVASAGWSHNFAVSGLAVRPIALACTALALGFVERGRQSRRWLAYALAGGCLGLAITEVPDVGAILALASAFVFWWTHLARPGAPDTGTLARPSAATLLLLPKFALYVACSALVAWQTISVITATQIQGVSQGAEESPEARFAWATQWSIPPAETWNIVSGDYFGSSMRSEASPYWGRLGRSEGWERTRQGVRNFSMTGWHLGVVPCLLLMALFVFMVRNKPPREPQPPTPCNVAEPYPSAYPRAFTLMVFVGGTLSLLLMWGKYFPLYRLFWSLPYINTIRNPEKWNGPFTLFACLGIAFMLDLLVRCLAAQRPSASASDAADRHTPDRALLRSALTWSGLGLSALALVILLGTAANRTPFIDRLTQEGYGSGATIAYDNAIAACVKVILIGALAAGLLALAIRKPAAATKPKTGKKAGGAKAEAIPQKAGLLSAATLVLPLTALLALGDLFFDNRPYVGGHNYKASIEANPLTDFLDAHRTEGRLKLMPAQHALLNNLRLTQLQVRGYDLFDPVSVSRMPTDYEALFKALERQPTRLWELGSLRYFLTLPGGIEEFNKMDGQHGRFVERLALGVGVVNDAYVPMASAPANQRYLRVVEFTGALPKYRLVGATSTLPDTPAGYAAALQRLAAPDFVPASNAIIHVTEPPTLEPTAVATATAPIGSVTVLRETPVDVGLRVTTDKPALLVRSTKYDRNWEATLDDKPAALLRANYLFQAVQVPAGTHDLSLSYRPSLKHLKLSVGTRLALLLMLALWVLKTPRAVTQP